MERWHFTLTRWPERAFSIGQRIKGDEEFCETVWDYAHDHDAAFGKLDKGLDAAATNGWAVADMAEDWNTILPE